MQICGERGVLSRRDSRLCIRHKPSKEIIYHEGVQNQNLSDISVMEKAKGWYREIEGHGTGKSSGIYDNMND